MDEVLILSIYGVGTSWIQERFGKFTDLSPSLKQSINSILNLLIPYIVIFIQPYWKVEFGNPTEVVSSLLLLLSPVFVWVVSQIAHHFDPARIK